MSKIQFGEPTEGSIRVMFNDVYCGDLGMLDDGSWQWFPVMRPGYIPSWMLRQIADKVDELNTNGDVQLMEELK